MNWHSRIAWTGLLCLLGTNFAWAGNQKVLLIGLDGVRADAMDAALSLGKAPNIQSIINTGSYANRATTSDLTGSTGGWNDVLTGVHRDEYDHNDETVADSLYERIKAYDPNLAIARFTTWSYMDTHWPTSQVDHSVYQDFFDPHQGVFTDGDEFVTGEAVTYLGNNDPDVVFFYQADPDISGHGGGEFPGTFSPSSGNYLNEIEETDGHVGQVINAIQNRSNFANEQWLVLLTSDHGGNGNVHTSNLPGEREVPFIIGGYNISLPQQLPSSNPMFVQPKNVDVAPTVLDHLGVPSGHAARDLLVGHVVGKTESLQPAIATGVNLIFNGDAEYDHGFNGHNGGFFSGNDPAGVQYHDQDVSGWDDWTTTASGNSMTVMYYGSDGGYPAVSDPGPASRGDNFFSAGIDGGSTMTQVIDVSSFSTSGLGFEMSAYLGGFASDNDRADFTVRFLDSGGSEISSFTLTGPNAAGRSNQTGLFFQDLSGAMPTGVDAIEFLLETVGNDGYADNLSFEITDTITLTGDFDDDLDIDGDDWVLYVAGLGSSTPGETDLTGDGMNNHADFIRFKQLYENFNGIGSFAEMLAGVPEPSSFALLLLGTWCLGRSSEFRGESSEL